MSTSEGVQKRNAFTAFAAFRIEGLEVSLNHAREIAVREELDAVGHYIEEAQGYLAQIRVLHEEALNEFSRAQGAGRISLLDGPQITQPPRPEQSDEAAGGSFDHLVGAGG